MNPPLAFGQSENLKCSGLLKDDGNLDPILLFNSQPRVWKRRFFLVSTHLLSLGFVCSQRGSSLQRKQHSADWLENSCGLRAMGQRPIFKEQSLKWTHLRSSCYRSKFHLVQDRLEKASLEKNLPSDWNLLESRPLEIHLLETRLLENLEIHPWQALPWRQLLLVQRKELPEQEAARTPRHLEGRISY